jgi:tripartite-type tricarboxylate transporter receptor subunit TctC
MKRRDVLGLGGSLLAWPLMRPALAQTSYPDRPIRLIVPFAPGGVTDVIARLWAQAMSQRLGQNFYVENQGGGGGNLGAGTAARLQPGDGYTVFIAASSFAINPGLYNKIPYDPVKDFAPVTLLAASPNVLVVHPSMPAKTLAELIAAVRADPAKYSYGMSGVGTPNHIQMETLKVALKLDMTTVPFSGGGPVVQSTVAGHTPVASTTLAAVLPLVAGGQLRALAVTGTKRAAAWPDVPTLTEAGVPGQEADTWTGVMLPAGAPKEIIDKLRAETVEVLGTPEMKQQLDKLGFTASGNTPAEFAARLRTEIAAWAQAIEQAGIAKQ